MDDADSLSLLARMFANCPSSPLCLDIVRGPPAQASFRSSNSSFLEPADVSTMKTLIDAMKRSAGLPTEDPAFSGSGTLSLPGQRLEFNLCPQFDGIVVTVQSARPRTAQRVVDQATARVAASIERKDSSATKPGSLWTRLRTMLRRFRA